MSCLHACHYHQQHLWQELWRRQSDIFRTIDFTHRVSEDIAHTCVRTLSSCRMREEPIRWPVKGREWWQKALKSVERTLESGGDVRREKRIWGKHKEIDGENCGQDGKRQERGWLNLGVRGHWSVWQPEIQIRDLEQGRRERRARRWAANRFCIFPLLMKTDYYTRLQGSIPRMQQVSGMTTGWVLRGLTLDH